MRAEKERLIRLVYRRSSKFELLTGTLETPTQTMSFDEVSFETLMGMAGEALRGAPDHRLLIKREEAPYPMALPENIEHLLRTDVAAAIAALTIAPQRIQVTPTRKVRTDQLIGTLRYGHDTLADAFGEVVYLKARISARGPQIEDPVSGRWVPFSATEKVLLGESGRWVPVPTIELLALKASRYYLPRRWNDSDWISHDSLEAAYASYLKEKANAESAI